MERPYRPAEKNVKQLIHRANVKLVPRTLIDRVHESVSKKHARLMRDACLAAAARGKRNVQDRDVRLALRVRGVLLAGMAPKRVGRKVSEETRDKLRTNIRERRAAFLAKHNGT